jgi:hypothetical protein
METKPTYENKIATIVVICGFCYLFAITFFRPSTPDNGVTIGVVGFIGTVLGYYFGSSRSSTKKDETISNIATDRKPVVNNAETVNIDKEKVTP